MDTDRHAEHRDRKRRRRMPVHGKSLAAIMNAIAKRARRVDKPPADDVQSEGTSEAK